MKKLLALTLSLLLVFSLIPVALVSAEGAVAKIGDTEYSSLFGTEGAFANAQDGDKIVMIADEVYDFAPEKTGATLISLSKAITLDLAGHTVNITRSNSNRGNVLVLNAEFSVVSTVDGLGLENTATKGVINAVATIFSANKTFNANNVELISSLSDDSYGMALSVGTTTTVTIKDCVLNAPKMAIRVSGGTPVFDVQDSTIYSQYFPLKNSSGKFSGTFKNCSIYATKNTGPEITCSELTLDNCTVYCNGSDQTMFNLKSGTLNLINGTVLDGKNAAKRVITVGSTATLVTDNATIKSPKSGASDAYAINLSGNAILGNTVVSASNKANSSNVNLYPYLADNKAIYTSDIPSEETLVAKDYTPASYKVLYIRDSLQAATTYDVTIDGEVVETVIEGKTYVVPASAEGYHYTDGTNDYYEGDEIVVNANVDLVSVINTYVVTIGESADAYDHGETFEVPVPDTGYQWTDGEVRYNGGEIITVTSEITLTKVIELTTFTYTMDEGSRIVGGYTSAVTAATGEFEEIDGDWVLSLPSKADQTATFILPEDWYVKPNYKAVKIEYSISRSANSADYVQRVSFADDSSNTNYISIAEGYQTIKTKYSVDVNEDVYGYRYFNTFLKGGANWSDESSQAYVYIDDVTVTFEYDFDYVAPEFEGEATEILKTQVGASIRLGEVNGIRFYTSLDVEALNAFVGDKEYEVGTLIAPKDIAGDYLTIEDDCAKVVYDMSNDLWANDEIVGSLANIKEKNWARDFVARAYILVDGVYYYSDVQCVRNIAGIADAYIADEKGNFDTLDADVQALVEAWAKAND